MEFAVKKSTLTKGFVLFVVLTVAVLVGILLWTTDRETWSQLAQFRWSFIPLLLAFTLIRWLTDGMVFVSLAKHNSHSSISIGRSIAIRLEGTLIAIVVPILVGTVSMHAYLLHKAKMSISESLAITVLRAILPVFIFLLNIPILLWMRNDPNSSQFFAQFIKLVSLPLVIIIVFFILTLFFPHQIKRAASSLVRWWGRIKFIHVERILAIEERLFHEIDQLSKIFWNYLKKRKRILLAAAGWLLASFIAEYFIAIGILWGFGLQPSVIRGLAVQCLMRPIIYLSPTPGGVGIWEFTYLGFFSLFMSKHLIGVAVLIWRLLITYIPCIVAAFFLISDFRRDENLRRLLLEKGELPEEGLDRFIDEEVDSA